LFEATHRQSAMSIFWHLDGVYLGTTQGTHRLSMTPDPGRHRLTLIDEEGTIIEQEFSVVDRNQ
jgi:penicillin-binding protein 1C